MTLAQLHAAAACMWIGLLAAESLLELGARDAAARRTVAAIHGRIDAFFEGPVVALLLVTGAVLLAQAWPASPLLLVKVGAGLIAIVANVICIPLVRARAHATDDGRVLALSRQIALTGLAIPFALLALVMGFGYFAPGR